MEWNTSRESAHGMMGDINATSGAGEWEGEETTTLFEIKTWSGKLEVTVRTPSMSFMVMNLKTKKSKIVSIFIKTEADFFLVFKKQIWIILS